MKLDIGATGIIIDDQPASIEQIENLLRNLSLARAQMNPPIAYARMKECERLPEFDPRWKSPARMKTMSL